MKNKLMASISIFVNEVRQMGYNIGGVKLKKVLTAILILLCFATLGCNQYKKIAPSENKQVQTDKKTSLTDISLVDGKPTVKNPTDTLVLINKERNLPSDWSPDDLIIPNVSFPFKEDTPVKYLRKAAAEALEDLFEQAKSENINLCAISGYRSFETQQRIYNNEVKLYGQEQASKAVAFPGQSEHQTGLAMDVSSPSMNYTLRESFGDSVEGKWLKEHAKDYGFIIRYPKDKEDITGYSYEPWHIRYVGEEVASSIMNNNITLEEYMR
jgi:LAS superfamily LD-carboxypeptidase LdcB